MKNEAVKQSPRQKINNWIDNSLFMHYFMCIGSLMFAGMALNSGRYLALAFLIGASMIFLPPMQKNIDKFVGHEVTKKYYMHMGIILLFIGQIALVRH